MAQYCPYCEEACDFFPLCHCGCGQSTGIPVKNNTGRKEVRGQAKKWVTGHHNRKLTRDEIREIRRLYLEEGQSIRRLSLVYGTSLTTMSDIINLKKFEEYGVASSKKPSKAVHS